jgi:hypothetical protein
LLDRFISRLGRAYTVPELKQAYQTVFRNGAGEHFVLPDLTEFTHAMEEAPIDDNMFKQGRAAGRRDVWLRIVQHLDLPEEDLVLMHKSRSIIPRGEKNG